MAEEQKSFSNLSQSEKDRILDQLKENADLYGYQEDIARSKANIQKHKYEEIMYALKIAELLNPEKNEQENQPDSGKNQS